MWSDSLKLLGEVTHLSATPVFKVQGKRSATHSLYAVGSTEQVSLKLYPKSGASSSESTTTSTPATSGSCQEVVTGTMKPLRCVCGHSVESSSAWCA